MNFSFAHAMRAAEDTRGHLSEVCEASELGGALARQASRVDGVHILLHAKTIDDMFGEAIECALDDRLRDLIQERILEWRDPPGRDLPLYRMVHVKTRVGVTLHVARSKMAWGALKGRV